MPLTSIIQNETKLQALFCQVSLCFIGVSFIFLNWLSIYLFIGRKAWPRINSVNSSVGNKLNLYSEVKNEVRFESYLDLMKNVKTRVAVTKMRISCHLLPIESGRYKNIPRVERLCPLCNRSEMGDEFHYLLKCTHSSLSHIRGTCIFLESLYSTNANFANMSYKALFLYIMSMCDQNILNLSASYIENILNCYAPEL